MDQSLYHVPVPPEVQALVALRLWRSPNGQSFNTSPYFRYYSEQCNSIFFAFSGLIPIKTHEQLMLIVDDLRRGLPRSAVKQELALRTFAALKPGVATDDELLECLIDLSTRILVMLDVGQFPRTHTGRASIQWADDSLDLAQFLRSTFQHATKLPHDSVKLGYQFTARNLDLIGGLKVELTTNITDHLMLQEADNSVLIFHHASFLKNQQSDLFPPGLIKETLMTLALLFPPRDRDTKRWYRKQDDAVDLDETVLHCGLASRNIKDYHFWRDRLVVLKEKYDEPQRTTWRQLWNDRREGTQWYALWVAVGFAIFFGLVQSIEGALQVYKAFRS